MRKFTCSTCGRIVDKTHICPNRRKDTSDRNKALKSHRWQILRTQALERDTYCDQYILYTEGRIVTDNLCVHHILDRHHYPEYTYDLDNVITLSADTHSKIHSEGADKYVDILKEIISKKQNTSAYVCIMNRLRIEIGDYKARLWRIWRGMKQRCTLETCQSYANYGGRGIKVCDKWYNDYKTFEFWALTNGYRSNLSLDRIDVNGNYEPSNCRWADCTTQANNKRDNHYITINGETKTIQQWSRIYKINQSTICRRILRGWDEVKAVTTPLQQFNTYTYNGFTGTLAEWSNKLGVKEGTLNTRLIRGWAYEKVFTSRHYTNGKLYEFKGNKYTVPELGKLFNKKPVTIRVMLNKGYTPYDIYIGKDKLHQIYYKKEDRYITKREAIKIIGASEKSHYTKSHNELQKLVNDKYEK